MGDLIELLKRIYHLIYSAIEKQEQKNLSKTERYIAPKTETYTQDDTIERISYGGYFHNKGNTNVYVDGVLLQPNDVESYATASNRRIKHSYAIRFEESRIIGATNELIFRYYIDSDEFYNTANRLEN